MRLRLRRLGGPALVLAVLVAGCSSSHKPESTPPVASNPPKTAVPTTSIPDVAGVTPAVPTIPNLPGDCGSTDQTAAVQAMIDRAPNGTPTHPTVIALRPGACYVVNQPIRLDRRANLVITGGASQPVTFDRPGTGTCSDRQHCMVFFVRGGQNITFSHVNVMSDNTGHAYHAVNAGQSAWWVWGTQGFTLTHDLVKDVWGDFVTLGPDTYRTWRWTTNVTITNDIFDGSGRQGIAITGAENVNISGDVIAFAAANDFDLEADSGTGHHDYQGVPTYGGAANVTIAHNLIGHAGELFLGNYGYCSQDYNVTVTHNTLRKQAFTLWSRGCPNVHRHNWTITDNTSDTPLSSPRGAIEFTYIDDSTISGNNIRFYPGGRGTAVRLANCSGIDISNNHFAGAGRITSVGVNATSMGTAITIRGNTLSQS